MGGAQSYGAADLCDSFCTPEMEEEDWEYVKVSELLKTIMTIFKGSANYMLGAVGESEKNSETE